MFTRNALESLLELGYEEAVKTRKGEMLAFYSRLFDDASPCAGCEGSLRRYWALLQQKGLQMMEKAGTSQFRLKEGLGAVQLEFGSDVFFSNSTLTDALAIAYLRINRNRIRNFSRYPENWEALLAAVPGKTEGVPAGGLAASRKNAPKDKRIKAVLRMRGLQSRN